jgi:hypothetical protein
MVLCYYVYPINTYESEQNVADVEGMLEEVLTVSTAKNFI